MKIKKKKGRPKLISDELLTEKIFHVFASKGYASTSISDLTQATGMKPASLYLAFGNKEGMYAAALKYYHHNWLEKIQIILNDKSQSFEHRILAFLESAFDLFSCNDTPRGCIIIFSAVTFYNDGSKFYELLKNERLAFVQYLEEEAKIAEKLGQLPKNMTPRDFANFIVTLERGLALTSLDSNDTKAIKSMLHNIFSLIFKDNCTLK